MSNHKPRVSIGLPVYNGERFLKEALESILSQTFNDFELIISDNASTDATQEICMLYGASDQRIRYYRNAQNHGAAYNYRRVFELSTGEYFKWAAADDVCEPEYLACCVEALDADSTIAVAHTKTRFIDEQRRPLDITDPGWDLRSADAAERLRYVMFSGHWVNIIFGLIRAKTLTRTRLVGSYPGGDYRVLGELALLGKFVELPHYFFLRRFHRDASSQHTDSLEWTVAFYSGTSHHLSMPTWQRTLDNFITIMRSRLRPRLKLSLLVSLLRRMHWQQVQFLRELKLAAMYFVRHFTSPSSSQPKS